VRLSLLLTYPAILFWCPFRLSSSAGPFFLMIGVPLTEGLGEVESLCDETGLGGRRGNGSQHQQSAQDVHLIECASALTWVLVHMIDGNLAEVVLWDGGVRAGEAGKEGGVEEARRVRDRTISELRNVSTESSQWTDSPA